jgi:hypothetical protein
MTDLALTLIIPSFVLIALGVDIAVLAAWLLGDRRS